MEPEQTLADNLETAATYGRNHETLLAVLRGGRHADELASGCGELSIHLERILVDRETDTFVTFEGEAGLEAMLKELCRQLPTFEQVRHDGRLMGLTGELDGPRPLPLSVGLGAGGQLACTVGPSSLVGDLLRGIEDFDRQVHIAACSLGKDYMLLAEGYNPYVSGPLDVPLVPRTNWTLLNAHLGQTGRYARDMMRCLCTTRVSLDYGIGRAGLDAYRLAVALSPIFSFLTDNVRSFRKSGARRCPRMTRTLVWDEVDPSRCGVVPGTFAEGFSLEVYLDWLERRQPILFTDAMGTTQSTGKRTTRDLMGDRVLSGTEALGLFDTVYPNVRLGRRMELLQADAMRPRMAAGYAAFVKGLFCTGLAVDSTKRLLGDVREADVEKAQRELRRHGWDATVYGTPATHLVDGLLQVVRTTLEPSELRVLDQVAELWDVNMVPRDAFVHQEVKAARGW